MTGSPETASGHAHQWGLSSTSRAFPIHERLKPNYPSEKANPYKPARVTEGAFDMHRKSVLRPINIAGQKFVGAIESDVKAPIANKRMIFFI